MFKKIHIIIGLFIVLYFLPAVNNKLVFFPVVLIASLIPDLDAVLAPKRDFRILRPLKNQTYKDFMHSYTVCIFLAILIAVFIPVLALPFFIGYSAHLFFDSLTVVGIVPFWPLKSRVSGFLVLGSKTEKVIEVVLGLFIIMFIFRNLF
ncbi:MAG: metal-dependent hydrolase [Nanoarchaeota archaeon]|nr:metal-dependent hydrolase [Nanoarchaeota archaeon]MBU1501645.1 metal-dependent hydrolase [Nanoarchaeota archaeon]MBU2458783.1 metal-dependent hydrolase [Nanoarchaeota archaeon]